MMQNTTIQIQAHIPFKVRLQLSQLDVHLDQSWHSTLVKIFKNHDSAVQRLIYEQILKPKGIEYDAKQQCFINTQPRVSLQGLIPTLNSPQTRHLAQNLVQSLDVIAKETDLNKLSEYLESIIEQIELIDTEDKPIINLEKKQIKTHFLYDIALIVANNKYQTPENSRHLTEKHFKSFIHDVYIKKQISGYSFYPLRPQALKLEDSPIMAYVLEQQKTRLFEIYEGTEYYYLITPASRDEDPYSLRRFLFEEPSRFREFFYLNGMVIHKEWIQQKLAMNTPQGELVRRAVECFVSINKSISPEMVHFIESLDLMFQQKILPLLEQNLDQKMKYSLSVNDRLLQLEQAISVYLLQEVHRAMDKIATSNDDFEYLFIHCIMLFSNLIFAYEVFQSQPALLFNQQAKSFKYRLIAWIKIVQKRQAEIFVRMPDEQEQLTCHKNAMSIIDNIKGILDTAKKDIRQIERQIKEKENDLKEQASGGFLKRLFNKKEDIEHQIVQYHDELFDIKRKSFLDIIKQAKQHTKNIIYLEYENIIGISDTVRHYAVNMGIYGFSRLPILVQLPEDKELFDIHQTYNSLLHEFNIRNQDWTIQKYEEKLKNQT